MWRLALPTCKRENLVLRGSSLGGFAARKAENKGNQSLSESAPWERLVEGLRRAGANPTREIDGGPAREAEHARSRRAGGRLGKSKREGGNFVDLAVTGAEGRMRA